jgi:hypothetical protein
MSIFTITMTSITIINMISMISNLVAHEIDIVIIAIIGIIMSIIIIIIDLGQEFIGCRSGPAVIQNALRHALLPKLHGAY